MDSNDIVYGQRGALPVPRGTAPGDLSTAPESGEQYMLRVRLEAASMPSVVVASNREDAIRTSNPQRRPLVAGSSSGEAPCELPAAVVPSSEWLASFGRRFEQSRRQLKSALAAHSSRGSGIPGSGHPREWRSFCYEIDTQAPGCCAMLDALAEMDQAMAMRLLKWLAAWLAKDRLRRIEAIWIWHLLLRLDALLDHEDTHALRDLCRRLKSIRSQLAAALPLDPVSGDALQGRAEEIAALNVLIAAVTRGYLQRDLE
ncbi:hypothetical protein GGI04_002217 [Coemansia thaxteri]|uniref:Gem-associated protein 2 n=1 Tax=Coemansia thaxteri TaxID=2663907 RepID=A0A9W8EK39_9FUNG|nr:hypothetical protein H4R26_002477 [Coemansia thaxteri]KAJ2005512.1 hypothetical protein GGI04_002217 [Coemansia thaxteri]KAJ2470517.1 hypothetical protein GGI02_002877 [Coemansia sp. RSA 2322]KAJ2484349.1 hypothetical protein EV174_002508 [Coemansia sp. RSA 2320]